ncbi:HAD-IA family hydrolase [Sedimentibacter sp. zth1]|uniref:HAD-IA family hydrolase n=1 Tax=Sedimentibacter sp. zth1 TaxID=2816908 RepID=UPI001A90EC65|nr:HAD-IA family hydrolase [Sedimentibacter sp. zth1]QSX04687.1 HAD-IA family hydrolase [Sedimentibacter sp. zth1]QSX06682.1 HAD-IA family hydrolase [Sedimentibacter sp. zth1]
MSIKGILIDSGRVLNGPRTGHWFITPNFFSKVDKKIFNQLTKKVNKAFSKAGDYMSKQLLIKTEEDEYYHFLKYYKIFFENLPELNLNNEDIEYIAKDLVYNYDKYQFFDDVYDVLPILNNKYRLAVVSDAWPSLENVYIKAGFRDYFSSFVISSLIGVTKPNQLMYETALNELNILPEEAIFVDDSITNCDGAKKLGIKTYLICRELRDYIYHKLTCRDHIVVRNLHSILKKYK